MNYVVVGFFSSSLYVTSKVAFAVSAYFFFNFGLKPHHFTCPAPVFLLALHQVIAEPVTFNCQGGEGDLQLIRLMKEYSFLL